MTKSDNIGIKYLIFNTKKLNFTHRQVSNSPVDDIKKNIVNLVQKWVDVFVFAQGVYGAKQKNANIC